MHCFTVHWDNSALCSTHNIVFQIHDFNVTITKEKDVGAVNVNNNGIDITNTTVSARILADFFTKELAAEKERLLIDQGTAPNDFDFEVRAASVINDDQEQEQPMIGGIFLEGIFEPEHCVAASLSPSTVVFFFFWILTFFGIF